MSEELNKNLTLEEPIDESKPALQFQYQYSYPFSQLAAAFLNKYTYEARTQLTTATGVTQLDEDRFMLYRRVETVYTNDLQYERVIYDRRNGGSITSELIRPRFGGERLFERGVITPTNEASAEHNHYVFDPQGIKSWKVD